MYVHLHDRWMYPGHTADSWPYTPLLDFLADLLASPERWQITDVSCICAEDQLIYMSLGRRTDTAPGRWEHRGARLTQRLGYAVWAVTFEHGRAVTESVEAFAARPTAFAHYFLGEGCAALPRHAVRHASWKAHQQRWGRDFMRVWKIQALPASP
jgi:hypothetical protein